MRRQRAAGQLRDRFVRHHAIAVHHVPRNLGVAFVGGVGDDGPAFGRRRLRGMAHGVVVAAGDPPHLGAIGGDRIGATLADAFGDEDHGARAEHRRPPGDRAAVIAVGGAGDRDGARDVAMRARCERLHRRARARSALDRRLDDAADRIGTAERLEAAGDEALALVLEPDRAEAEPRGKARQGDQGRRRIAGPRGDFRLRRGKAGFVQRRVGTVGRGAVGGFAIVEVEGGHWWHSSRQRSMSRRPVLVTQTLTPSGPVEATVLYPLSRRGGRGVRRAISSPGPMRVRVRGRSTADGRRRGGRA